MKTSSSVGLTSAVTIPIDPPVAIEQRPPGVAGVDRRIDLDQPVSGLVAAGWLERAIEPGDDTGAHRAAEAERAAEREGLAALLHRGRIAEHGRDEVRRRLEGTHDRDVVSRAGSRRSPRPTPTRRRTSA